MIENNENELISANTKLNITKDKIIFIYTAPKVGSTGLVSSFRIFALNSYDMIHIHDDKMLEILGNITTISVNDIIEYNSRIGKKVYVIDIYRNPIERKISAFFEKISSYHFNNSEQNINRYNVNKVIKRFNNIFPHIANGDHFIDKYGINDLLPEVFPYNKKYLLIEKNNIKYIKLRLKDSDEWERILSLIFGQTICSIRDYQTENKIIKDLYRNFNETYHIPENYLNEIMQNKYFNYYYSDEEKQQYFNKWILKIGPSNNPYNEEQFKIYEEISIENCRVDNIQVHHYIDDGCSCNACVIKRNRIKYLIINKKYNGEKIYHVEAKSELLGKKLLRTVLINNEIRKLNNKLNNKLNGELVSQNMKYIKR